MDASNTEETSSGRSGCGCFGGMFSVGGVIAMILSYHTWHSIGWMLVNALFGWAYVAYWLIFYWR